MVYEITKNIKGRKYRYLVKGVREGRKVRLKFVKYLGPVEPVNKSERQKGGRKPAVFVRSLSEDVKQRLTQEQQNPQAFIRDRARITLLSSEGKTPKQIAEQLKRGYVSILNTINNFNKEGLGILARKSSPGRPRRISKEQENDLVETALKSPKVAGLPYNNWSCRLLSLWFEEKYKQQISDEWVRTLLRRNKVTFTMPKHKLLKANEPLRRAFKKS